MTYQKPLLYILIPLLLLFLTSDNTGTSLTASMAWIQRPTMSYHHCRRHHRRTNYIIDREKDFINSNMLLSSRLFSSMFDQTSQSSSTAQNNNDFENSYRHQHQLPASQTIIDVTLAGDYLIQMLITSPNNSKNVSKNLVDDMSLYTWSLYRIEDVITASLRATSSEDEEKEIIWTNGTRASEALRYMKSSISSSTSSGNDHNMPSLSSSSKETISQLKPRAEIICSQNDQNDYLELGVQLEKYDNDNNNDCMDKKFLALLQLLQAQWVVGQQQTEKRQTNDDSSLNNKSNVINKDNDEDYFYNLRISRSLLSQHRISQLFSSNAVAALLDNNAGFDTTDVEWIEMMTGSYKIVGRLPRSLVHKYNILHRGIGAFVTKDRPIDWSSISSSLSSSFPDVYVHRRAESKKMFPSLYDMFVGGVSLAGEPSEATAQREIAEELGLSKALSKSLSNWSSGKPFLTCLICTGYNRCIVDLFQYVMDTNNESVAWQEEEVAWGDFVNYNVVMASADLSMQRAASAGTWPGYSIQSRLEGTMSIEEADINNSKLAVTAYSESWKEWDFVPDGLLVWKSWLEFLETEKNHHHHHEEQLSSIQGQYSDDDKVGNNSNSASLASNTMISFEVEVVIEEGQIQIVTVELSSAEEIVSQSQELAELFNTDVNDMQLLLQKSWDDITFIPPYNGPALPVTSENTNDDRAECKIELPSGLVLELRPSTIGEAAGLGIFVTKRSSNNTSDSGVLQTQGSAFCGYGPCEKVTNSLTDLSEYQLQRSFEFLLSDGLESYVWYEGKLLTVWEVMQSSGATGVHAHCLVETKTAAAADEADKDNCLPLPKLSLIPDPEGKPCYLIPPAERPDPKSLTIQSIGQMCNDLAGGISVTKQTEEEYDIACYRDNLLVLVPRVMIKDDGILQPIGMPILTLAKTVNVTNVMESMEVGLRYGREYWVDELL